MKHNRQILYLFVLTLTLLFLLGCAPAPQDTTAEDLQAINAISKQWDDYFNSGNSAAVAALYAEEAKLLPPNNQMIVGRESIQEFFQAGFDAGVGDLQGTVIELSVSGDMAHVVGKYTLTIQPEEGEAISDNGKYMEIWRRVNGSWKINTAIWNTNVPLPVPEALPTAEEEE